MIRKYHQFNGNLCSPGKKLLLKRGGPGLPINEELAQRQEAKNRNVWSFFCVTKSSLRNTPMYHTKTNPMSNERLEKSVDQEKNLSRV